MSRSSWFSSRRAPVSFRSNTNRKPVRFVKRPVRRGLQLESLEDRMMLSANVYTDKADYAPGEIAQIVATDFAVGEAVQFQVLHNDGTPNTGAGHTPWTVVDGSADDLDGQVDGNIFTTWYVNPDDSAGSAFDLTAAGLSSGRVAFTTFTDGNPAVSLEQWENLTNQWANGQANSNQAKYLEGDVVPYWLEANNLTVGTTYGVRISLDYYQSTTDAGGFLYLDTYNRSITGVPQNSDDGTGGPLPALSTDSVFAFTDPLYANPGLAFKVYNADVLSVTYSVSADGLKRFADVRFRAIVANEADGEATVNIYWGERLALPNEVISSANSGGSKGASGFTGGSLQTKIEGTGVGGTTWITPSNAVQLMPGVVVQGAISGYKWNDLDGQGDKDAGEPGLAGWTIQLYKDDGDNVFDADDTLIATKVTSDGTTDANGDGSINSADLGFYKFAPVLRGTYFVKEVQQAGWTQTYPTSNLNGPLTISETNPTYTNVNFGNQQIKGSIKVVKNAVPDSSQDFTFDPSSNLQAANFLLDDDADPTLSNNKLFSDLVAGTYTVQEISIPAGWSLTNIVVTGAVNSVVQIGSDGDFDAGDSLVSVALVAGENVTISYTNTKLGSITVVKDAVPDSSQDFTFDPSSNLQTPNFLLDDDANATLSNTKVFSNLLPGTYTVQEISIPAGWNLTNIVVNGAVNSVVQIGANSGFDAGDSLVSVALAAGENVTILYTNTQQGRIIVEKQTNPDGCQETFEFDPSYGANFNLADNGTNNSGFLTPGSYTVEELAKTGWDLSNIQIVSGDTDNGSTVNGSKATIDLDAGEVVTVRFTNTQRGKIIVEKQTNPDGSVESFEFDPSYGANFNLADNGTNTSGLLTPGSYTVEELAKTGWDLSNVEIVSGDTDNGSTISDSKATIDLDAGEVITVRFTNTQRGKIIVEKQTNPDGSVESFEFDPSYGANFNLSDNDTNTSSLLTPGSYTVEELAKSGWDLSNVEIVSGDTDNGSTVNGSKATIDLDAGEVVTVRFTNTQRGKIIVEKQTNPDGSVESFEFDPSYGANFNLADNGTNTSGLLTPGSYTIEELAKTGWDLSNVEIVSGDTDNGSTISDSKATIDLDAGEVITLRFTNTQRGRITVEKQTNPDGSYDLFEFNASNGASFMLPDGGYAVMGDLVAGSYTVEELTKTGWDLSNIEIVSGDTDGGSTVNGNKATIDLDPGEDILVRFTNTQRGRIIVEKQTNPDGSLETFEFDPNYGNNFQLADNGTNTSGYLTPGSYTVAELTKAGWDLTNIEIVSGDTDGGSTTSGNTATIDLDAGEEITVRFNNRKHCFVILGPDKGNESVPIIKIVDQATGEIYRQFYAFEPSFRGGVRIATGDMTGDGIDEIVVAPGQGRVGEVRVFTQDGIELTQFRVQPYGSSYSGGVEVAVGDVNGDGKADIVTTNSYGRSEVRVFYNNYNAMLPLTDAISDTPSRQFFVYPSSFLGGAVVTVASMGTFSNGTTVNASTPDARAEIIVGNGAGMRSTIYVYDMSGATPKVVDTILPFSNSFKGGITLSTARVNGDAIPDLIVAAGNKGGSAVEIWSGITNDTPDVRLAAFTAFGNVSTKNAPVHATGIDITGDEIADVIAVVQGTNGTSNQMRYFRPDGNSLSTFNGFNGPWNIASSCDLSVTRDYGDTAAADQYFSQLVEEVTTVAKKAKKKKK